MVDISTAGLQGCVIGSSCQVCGQISCRFRVLGHAAEVGPASDVTDVRSNACLANPP